MQFIKIMPERNRTLCEFYIFKKNRIFENLVENKQADKYFQATLFTGKFKDCANFSQTSPEYRKRSKLPPLAVSETEMYELHLTKDRLIGEKIILHAQGSFTEKK